MIKLDTTSRKLQFLLSGAVTTNELPVCVTYTDINDTTGANTDAGGNTQSNGTTAVDIVAAPAASVVRIVDFINIYNRDTVSATVTVQLIDGATTRILQKVTLATGKSLQYTSKNGFSTFPNQVSVEQLAGTAIDTNSGNKSAGTQRFVLATDQPTMSNAQPVSISTVTPASPSDAVANPTAVPVESLGMLWDSKNSQWVRSHTRVKGVQLLASSSRTASSTSAVFKDIAGVGFLFKGLRLFVRVTTNTGAISITPGLWTSSPVGGDLDLLWPATTIITSAPVDYFYEFYPGANAAATGSSRIQERLSLVITGYEYFVMTHNNANPVTYYVDAIFIG